LTLPLAPDWNHVLAKRFVPTCEHVTAAARVAPVALTKQEKSDDKYTGSSHLGPPLSAWNSR